MKEINLFFGSFNPIHIGHLIIAETVLNETDATELWFIVSPQNPFKNKNTLLAERDRLHLINLAIEDNYKFKASDVEFNLPKPSYTINTLLYLKEKHPNKKFNLIMGSDNLTHLHKWQNYESIIKNHKIIVYPRTEDFKENINEKIDTATIEIIRAPLLNISATQIRNKIKNEKSVKYMVPQKSLDYIKSMNFYKTIQNS